MIIIIISMECMIRKRFFEQKKQCSHEGLSFCFLFLFFLNSDYFLQDKTEWIAFVYCAYGFFKCTFFLFCLAITRILNVKHMEFKWIEIIIIIIQRKKYFFFDDVQSIISNNHHQLYLTEFNLINYQLNDLYQNYLFRLIRTEPEEIWLAKIFFPS